MIRLAKTLCLIDEFPTVTAIGLSASVRPLLMNVYCKSPLVDQYIT